MAVSPGSATGAQIAETCPTFSWGSVPGAESYELVVYRLGEGYEKDQPWIRRTIVGAASSWTPSLDSCLERGGRYAWSVRAVGEEATSDWSKPSLFGLAPQPSVAELEEALAVVRQHLAERDAAVSSTPDGTEAGGRTSASPTRATAAAPTASAAPAATTMSVEGNVDATSFTGDGSTLDGVALTGELCALWEEVSANPPPASCKKVVFTTSTLHTGNLGGLAGADAECNERAAAAGLQGSFKAWLSDGTCGPADACRGFTQSSFPYVRVDGIQIAANWADLVDGSIAQQLRLDESGAETPIVAGGVFVWTNTLPSGNLFSAANSCNNWTDDVAGTGSIGRGDWTSNDEHWTIIGFADACSLQRNRLYCFQQ